jgi:hypothetical protein
MMDTLLKAMVVACFVVVVWVNDNEDVIGDGVNGLLVERNRSNPLRWIRSCAALSENIDLAHRFDWRHERQLFAIISWLPLSNGA